MKFKDYYKILGVDKKEGLLDLKDLLKKLAQLEITNVLVEGGGRVAGSFFDENLVDCVLIFISPKIIGGKESVSGIQGKGVNKLVDSRKIKEVNLRQFNRDLLIEGIIQEY